MIFFFLLNVNLGLRRQIRDLYYLTSTMREAAVERRFLVEHLRESPIVS